MDPMSSLTGQTWTITSGEHVAEIVQLGGTLRSYAVGGRPLLAGFAPDAKPDAGRGQVLMPWPNRIRDGRYTFEGRSQQLALSEPAKANASHGLVRWATWEAREVADDAVTVGTTLLAGQGWDWPLELQVTYAVGDDGLTVTPRATNVGDRPAPFGYGQHPYLTTGETNVDELTLTVPGGQYVEVDERSLPVRTLDVDDEHDLRDGRALRGVVLDTAYTALVPDADGRWRVTLRGPERSTVLWAEADTLPWVQCFTADTLPAGAARTTGVAVEPLSCPADAFNSGDGLVTLAPGETWTATWGVQPG